MYHYSILLLLLFVSTSTWAVNQVTVSVSPENKEVKENIENYIGNYEEEDRRTLLRLQTTVKKQVIEASQALGYYDVKVMTYVSRKSPHQLRIKVILGKPIRLRNIAIVVKGEADHLKKFKIPDGKALTPGKVLSHGAYDAAKSQIQAQALRYGFFFGEFTKHQLNIYPEDYVADINLEYQSGPRASLGQVTFTGKNNPFDKELLDRFVHFEPGTPYDSELLANLNNDLQSSNYFQNVLVDALPTDKEHLELPVTADVNAAKPRTLGVGLGFSTDIGPRATLSWERPWINSKGHQLGFNSEISAPRQNISSWYQIPMENPLTDNIRFTAGLQHEDLVDTESTLLTLGVERNKKLDNGWMRTLFLRWQSETYNVGEDDATRMFLMPGVSFSYLKADNTFDPNRGYRLQFDLSGAKEDILSATDFIRCRGLAKGLYTFQQKHRVLGRIELGGIDSPNYNKIPPSLRFSTGGDQTVRGYNYQTLSPKDIEGNNIGGRYLIVGSLEYQYTFAEKWRIATFVDQGNAMDSWSGALDTGVGAGIRWVSPVGPIRVDIAHGIENNSLMLHFSMGPEL